MADLGLHFKSSVTSLTRQLVDLKLNSLVDQLQREKGELLAKVAQLEADNEALVREREEADEEIRRLRSELAECQERVADRNETIKVLSNFPDWFRVFNGPVLQVIAKHLDKMSTCNLRLTCKMLGRMDSLKAKCFERLVLRIRQHPENGDFCFSMGTRLSQRKKFTFICLHDRDSFGALERVAPLVKAVVLIEVAWKRPTVDQELALTHPLPFFPNVSMLDCGWGSRDYGQDCNPETLLALARLTPAVSQVTLRPNWAFIPGPFHAQLLSLWTQLKGVRVHGYMDARHRFGHQTLMTAAASQGLLIELTLANFKDLESDEYAEANEDADIEADEYAEAYEDAEIYAESDDDAESEADADEDIIEPDQPIFDLSALIIAEQASLRVLYLEDGMVSSMELTALFRMNALEALTLDFIHAFNGYCVVSRDVLTDLASVPTLKELKLVLGKAWSCTAMDIVRFFRDAKFSLRKLYMSSFPFTSHLLQAISETQKDMVEIMLFDMALEPGESERIDRSVLDKLPKLEKCRIDMNFDFHAMDRVWA